MNNGNDTAANFDPGAPGVNNGNFFGFPYSLEQASTVIYPVTWDVTTSYGGGASRAPQAILEASPQLDFFDFDFPCAWENRIGTHPGNALCRDNDAWRAKAEGIISSIESGTPLTALSKQTDEVNEACRRVNLRTREDVSALLDDGKKVVLLGGDHSTPLGYIEALAERHDSFSILHIDAHADLRDCYEGFEYSHASVMFNAMKLPSVTKLVQVGVRDVSPGEISFIENSGGRISLFNDYSCSRRLYAGEKWNEICLDIVSQLQEKVYVSFDIDGLDPALCPGTGTPVPGGLSFQQAAHLLLTLKTSGRKIIGADLNEVCPSPSDGQWNANVGARILYKLCSLVR